MKTGKSVEWLQEIQEEGQGKFSESDVSWIEDPVALSLLSIILL